MLEQLPVENIEHIFDILVKGLSRPEVAKTLPLDMKIAILNAADVDFQVIRQGVVVVKVFFMTIVINSSDPDNIEIKATIDAKDLERYNV